MVTSDANSTASPSPLGSNDHRPDPKSNTSPRADDTNDERGRCIDSSLTASVPRDVLMEIVHEVEYRGTGQSSLDGSHQLSTGLHILDQLVAILLATVEESVQVHSRVDQREQGHEATNDAHRDPVVWADIIIVRHVGLGGHNDYIARSLSNRSRRSVSPRSATAYSKEVKYAENEAKDDGQNQSIGCPMAVRNVTSREERWRR